MSEDMNYAMFSALTNGGQSPKVAYEWLRQQIGEESARRVYARYEKEVGRIRTLTDPITFDDGQTEGWYTGPGENDRYWPALKKYLLETKGWQPDTVQSIDDATSKVLSLMQQPGRATIDTRGLVVGYVQSGKTANYTALIAKAADVGYRFFIVLAGIHNSLRAQTEARLWKELINLNKERWFSLTEESIRYTGNATSFMASDLDRRVLCVVKKNARVLERLLKWFKAAEPSSRERCQVLIIDDEADQAGLNASKDPEKRTAINRLILGILDSLGRSAYIGYTATPFANVFIDPSGADLYPSSFIAALPKPDAYFGAETLFGRDPLDEDEEGFECEGLDMIRTVPVEEIESLRPRSAKTRFEFEAEVTPSLERALDYFLLACAARRARGSKAHASMLVHTTLYADPHESIGAQIEAYCKARTSSLKRGKKTLLGRLRELWEDECLCVDPRNWDNPIHEFEELVPLLVEVAEATEVVVENAQSLSRLAYGEESKIQIAVGGNTLSRGLTLEGLLVSFFVRSASAYDTLLQMGRWFGYRPGYEDLPRIWMTEELQGYFTMLATVEQEIRNDIARYDSGTLTPKTFGVRIASHPGLAITSKLKMKHAVTCDVSFADQIKQTRCFKHRDAQWLADNQRAVEGLLAKVGTPEMVGVHRIYRGVSVADILEFLAEYHIHEDHPTLQDGTMEAYIRAQSERGSLRHWNVALVQLRKEDKALGYLELGKGVRVNLVGRTRLKQGDGSFANLGTIATQEYYNMDLDEERRKKKVSSRNVNDPPMLAIIPIAKQSPEPRREGKKPRVALDAVDHILGLMLCFPPTKVDTPQHYYTVALPSGELDEEEIYEDEEEEQG